ncbi:MAG: MFS transporter [Phototrophicaceae bacterium]
MAQYIRLLRESPNFTLLWLAQVVSLTGDWFNTIVLSAMVADFSGGSGLAISLFLMARFLPPLVVSPFTGVIVDRFDRKLILVYSNVIRTGIVLMFLLATGPDLLWLIYLLTIMQFTLSALFEPGQSAIIPSLIRRSDLVIANTLVSITWSVMLALGAIIGGVVAAFFGASIALVIGASTFAVAGYLIARIQVPPEAETRSNLEAGAVQPTGSFGEGLRYLARNKMAAAALLVKGGGSVGNVDTLMTVFATQVFILGTDGQLSLGIMYSSFGIGAILGPVLLNRINDGSIGRMRRLVVIGFVLGTVGWIVLGAAGSLAILSLALLIRAMGGSANWTYSTVIIQKSVDDRYLGRVFALDLAFFQLVTVVSTIAHGVLIDALGVDYLGVISYGTAVVSLIPLVLWMAVVPRMERREAARTTAPV